MAPRAAELQGRIGGKNKTISAAPPKAAVEKRKPRPQTGRAARENYQARDFGREPRPVVTATMCSAVNIAEVSLSSKTTTRVPRGLMNA
jgi:hypothetical protein